MYVPSRFVFVHIHLPRPPCNSSFDWISPCPNCWDISKPAPSPLIFVTSAACSASSVPPPHQLGWTSTFACLRKGNANSQKKLNVITFSTPTVRMVPIGSRVTVDDISSAFVEKDDVEKRKRRRKSGVVYNSFMIIGKCFQYKNIFYTLVKSTILKSMLLGETNIPIFV